MRGGGISTAVQASDKADSTTNRRYVGKLDSIQKINEVIIVGTPVIPKYREVIPAQVLKEVDLQRLNSLSVADAIRYFAGVQLKDYGGVGGLKTVNIRSMGTNHMAVFYDGIQLGNAQNGQIDLGRFSLDNMEAVSLYNGQKSEIFQSAKDFGAAGSIYIRTRIPKFEAGKIIKNTKDKDKYHYNYIQNWDDFKKPVQKVTYTEIQNFLNSIRHLSQRRNR